MGNGGSEIETFLAGKLLMLTILIKKVLPSALMVGRCFPCSLGFAQQ